jgi:hypothetical protein
MGVRFGLMMRWLGEDVEFIGSCSELLCVCVYRGGVCVWCLFFLQTPPIRVFFI